MFAWAVKRVSIGQRSGYDDVIFVISTTGDRIEYVHNEHAVVAKVASQFRFEFSTTDPLQFTVWYADEPDPYVHTLYNENLRGEILAFLNVICRGNFMGFDMLAVIHSRLFHSNQATCTDTARCHATGHHS